VVGVAVVGVLVAGIVAIVTRPASAVRPGPLQPAAAGSYRYAVTCTGSMQASGEETDRYRREGTAGGDTQASVTVSSLCPPGSVRTEVAWNASGYYVRAQTISGSLCTWTPPLATILVPLAVGKQWSLTSTCTYRLSSKGNVTLRLTGKVSVIGTARVKVGGTAVDVWVVDSNVDISGTAGSTEFTIDQASSQRIAPAAGIPVFEQRTTTQTLAGRTTSLVQRRQLETLQPAA
jgi:hypothetical protein